MRRARWGAALTATLATLALAACKKDEAAKPAAGSTVAPGQPPSARAAEPPRLPVPPRPFPGRDRDPADAQVPDDRPTREEVGQRRNERRQEEREMYDADKDGQLSPDEREIMREARVAGMVDHLDGDRDGKLTPAELAVAGGGDGGRGAFDFTTLDGDQDGFVTVEEVSAGMQARGPGRRRGDRGDPGPGGIGGGGGGGRDGGAAPPP